MPPRSVVWIRSRSCEKELVQLRRVLLLRVRYKIRPRYCATKTGVSRILLQAIEDHGPRLRDDFRHYVRLAQV